MTCLPCQRQGGVKKNGLGEHIRVLHLWYSKFKYIITLFLNSGGEKASAQNGEPVGARVPVRLLLIFGPLPGRGGEGVWVVGQRHYPPPPGVGYTPTCLAQPEIFGHILSKALRNLPSGWVPPGGGVPKKFGWVGTSRTPPPPPRGS